MTLRLGLFYSGLDDTAHDVLRAVARLRGRGQLDVSFTFAFCSWEEGELATPEELASRRRYLDLVRSLEIPVVMLSARATRERYRSEPSKDWMSCFGRQMRKLLYERAFELGILDGRMAVDEDSCVRFDLVGLSPTLPEGPKGGPQEIMAEVLRTRPRAHGAMTRVCTGRRDSATPLTYCSYPLAGEQVGSMWRELDQVLAGRPLAKVPAGELQATRIFQHIGREGRARVPPLVTYTIKMFADGDLDIVNGRPLVDGASLTSPIDLTRVVDEALDQAQQ